MTSLEPFRSTLFAITFAVGWTGLALAQGKVQHALTITIDGIIDDVKSRQIERTIVITREREAERAILKLDILAVYKGPRGI